MKEIIYKGEQSKGTSRRDFVKISGIITAAIPFVSFTDFINTPVSVVIYPTDEIALSAPVQWAANELVQSLLSKGISINKYEKLADAKSEGIVVVVAGANSAIAAQLSSVAGINIPLTSESVCLAPVKFEGKQVVMASGYDERGVVYALLELADRVQYSEKPLASLKLLKPVIETPANSIRSLNRLFVSDVEDKSWFNDRQMWPAYLTMLATQRFNRFNLSFGIGYDFLQRVTDAYFLFAYPFLFAVPGYNVRVPQLPYTERDSNLAMLKFISEETVRRGLQFQLGLWMHGYEWLNTTNANYTIEGITRENHAAYCRDAVRQLLQMCPAISGITFRVHGESGVNEGSYNFWKTVFDGVKTCGRKVEIDMHTKGMDQTMIDTATDTGMPVVLSPKYWAEHMGMPYHQADIRSLEIPNENHKPSALMNLSAGARSFLRYGYGDLMKEDRPYKILHRIWPGTQRLLLWGDPVSAAAHSRAFGFCGSDGVELMEPLSFKGRRGSGIAGDRCGYADASLRPRWDWEKYLYTLRIFGRLMYNPNATSDIWKRYLDKELGAGAKGAVLALANVSRILPVVLTAHGASAGNNMYWPEIYTNQPITDPLIKNVYTDTPAPKTFGNVTPLDPQLFLSINDFVKGSLDGKPGYKYNPVEVAQWLEDYAVAGEKNLTEVRMKSGGKNKAVYRRMLIDVSIQIGLGHFFASKFRAGVLYGIYEQTNDRKALEEGLKMYQKAREYWAELAHNAKTVYQMDITVGEHPWLRGHWLDRLPAIDEDVANMAKKLEAHKSTVNTVNERVRKAVQDALGRPNRRLASCNHNRPGNFVSGQPLSIVFSFDTMPQSAVLYYRRVTQAERYQKMELKWEGKNGEAVIPGDYTNSPYPLQYYLEITNSQDSVSLYPGFNVDLDNQPYFTVRKA